MRINLAHGFAFMADHIHHDLLRHAGIFSADSLLCVEANEMKFHWIGAGQLGRSHPLLSDASAAEPGPRSRRMS